jgi:hypothetical protein
LAPEAASPPTSRVTYTIEPAGPENFKLTVVHEEFEPDSEVDDGLRQGWPAILSSLKRFLETGKALDVTRRWAREGKGARPVRWAPGARPPRPVPEPKPIRPTLGLTG